MFVHCHIAAPLEDLKGTLFKTSCMHLLALECCLLGMKAEDREEV